MFPFKFIEAIGVSYFYENYYLYFRPKESKLIFAIMDVIRVSALAPHCSGNRKTFFIF